MDSRRIDISVIVVFHNAAKTIERTLESLAVQTLKSVEYIFVDDGSTDDSVAIVREFMLQHPEIGSRCKLKCNSECRGCANAAAVGLSVAAGEYVTRCDADDYLECDALQTMLDGTDGGRYDFVVAPYYEVYPEYRRLVQFVKKPKTLNDMPIDTPHFSLCNKLLRRQLLVENGIAQFDGLDCWEDLGVVSRVMALHPQVNFVDVPTYNYVRNPKGKTLSRSNKYRLLGEHLAVCQLVEKWLIDRGQEREFEEFLNHLKFCAKVKLLRGRGKDVARWKATYSEVNNRVMSLRHIAFHLRLMFAVVSVLPTVISQAVANCCDVFYVVED